MTTKNQIHLWMIKLTEIEDQDRSVFKATGLAHIVNSIGNSLRCSAYH